MPRSKRGDGPPSTAADALNDEDCRLTIHRFGDAAVLSVNGVAIYLSRAQAGRVSRVLRAVCTDIGKHADPDESIFEPFRLKGPLS